MAGRLVSSLEESQCEYRGGKAKKLIKVKDLWR